MLFNVIAVSSLLWIVTVQATPTGNHTCTGVVKHSVTVRVNVTEPVTYRTYTWCLRVPPRCSKYTVQLKDRVKIHTEMHNRTITVCCKGYVEMDYKCVPACPPQTECPNMHCNRTNHCYCTPGYQGFYCNYPCERGFWGADCKKTCDCPDGYTCHHLTGDCMLDDRPPLTTKFRRTTTTTVATLSPETKYAETAATTTAQPTTEPSTTKVTTIRTTPSATTTMLTTPILQHSTVYTTSPPTVPTTTTTTTTSTTPASTVGIKTTPASTVGIKTTLVTEPPTISTQFHHGFPSSTANIFKTQQKQSPQTTNTMEPSTIETAVTFSTTQMTKESFSSSNATLHSTEATTTSTELPIKKSTSVSVTTLIETEDKSYQTTEKTNASYSLETQHTIFANNFSEDIKQSTSTSTIFTDPNTVPITISIPNAEITSTTEMSTTSSTPLTSPTTLNTIPQPNTELQPSSLTTSPSMSTTSSIMSTIPTTTSTTPTTFATINYSTQDSLNHFYTSLTISDKINISSSTNKSTPSNVIPVKIISSLQEDNLDINANFTSTEFQINTPSTQRSDTKENDQTTKLSKTVSSFSDDSEQVATTTVGTPKTSPAHSEVSGFIPPVTTEEVLLDTLAPSENTESTTVVTTTTVDVTTKTEPTKLDFTVKTNLEAVNTPYEGITESLKPSEVAKKKEKSLEGKNFSKVLSKVVFNKEKKQTYTTHAPHLDSVTITPEIILSTTTESSRTTLPEIFSSVTPFIDKSITEAEIKRVPISGSKSTTGSYTVSNNENFPFPETTEYDKYEENIKMPNIIRKSFKNSTNIISSVNEVSTKFGQPHFDTGKAVSEMKLKQKPETTTTLSSKEDASIRNLWVTTNLRPVHTWYSHVKDYQRKVKNKEDMKSMKTTPHLELPATEKYDISEESNIIDSMQTTYTERGYRGNSGAPPIVNEETNVASSYVKHGQIKYNLSGALAEEVQAGRNDKTLFSLYSTSTIISGIALILLISTSTALWLCLRRKREPTTLRGPCIMAYGPPNEFTLNPLMYETVYPLDPLEGDQCVDPEIFFCPTFTNNYAEKINRELSELNYDHPRSSMCEPLYAEIRY